jgi:hypothetical protein
VSAPNEYERRRFNVMEALIIAGVIALMGTLLWTRDAVISLQATQQATNLTLAAL